MTACGPRPLKLRRRPADPRDVRFTRGFLAGLGAATSLVLAGSLALLAISTVVAFNGWPELRSAEPPSETATLAVISAPAAAAAQPVKLAAPVRRPQPPSQGVASRQSATTAKTAPSTEPPASAPLPQDIPRRRAGDVSSSDTSEPAPAAETPPPLGVGETTQPLADGVRKVTKDLGDTLVPNSPTLNQTVDGVGETVGTTVEGLGDAVGNVVGGLLGRSPRTP